jgi:peptidoglycan-N-acetylglucosamine deacetylase
MDWMFEERDETSRHWWIAGLVGGVVGGLMSYALGAPRSQVIGRTIWRGPRDRRQIALTFDNGPSPKGTEGVLDLLRQEGVTATFFLLGRQVEAYPALARAIVAEGHLIGNHGYTHRNLAWAGPEATANELDRGYRAIESVCGVAPMLFRPPYGTRNFFLPSLISQRGWQMVHWSRSTGDWRRHGARPIDNWVNQVRNGDILLWHDGGPRGSIYPRTVTIAALSQVIPFLRRRGFAFVPVNAFLPGNAYIPVQI